jgi:integrase
MSTRALTENEQTAILTALGASRDRLLFLAGIFTGFRIGELLSLRVGQVWHGCGPAREITVMRQNLKGGAGQMRRRVRSRTVAVHPTLQAAIEGHIRLTYPDQIPPPDDFLFRSRKGLNKPISPAHAYDIITCAAKVAGNAARVGTHSMRKTFAKSIFDLSGHNLVLTQRALGHSSILTTGKYLESTTEDVTTAIMNLPGPRAGSQLNRVAISAV